MVALLFLLLPFLASCEEQEGGKGARLEPPRPETRQLAAFLDGREERLSFRLLDDPSLPFTTYIPAGWRQEPYATELGRGVRLAGQALTGERGEQPQGGQQPEIELDLFSFAPGVTRQQAEETLQQVVNRLGKNKRYEEDRPSWTLAHYGLQSGKLGSASLGQHRDRYYYIVERSDLGPAFNNWQEIRRLVFDQWRWRDSGEPFPGGSSGPELAKIDMIDEMNGWALSPGQVLRTADGGRTWRDVTPQGASWSDRYTEISYIRGSSFLDAQTARLAVWHDGEPSIKVWATADGGSTWRQAPVPARSAGVDMDFVNNRDGWLLVHQGAATGSEAVDVFRTTDGGNNWTRVSGAGTEDYRPAPGNLPFGGGKTGIGFADPATGWVSGYAPAQGALWLYVTRDGGITWEEERGLRLPPAYRESEAETLPPRFFDARRGVLPVVFWYAGTNMVFYSTKDGGRTWSAGQAVATSPSGPPVYDFSDLRHGWVWHEEEAKLFRTADGGASWQALTPQPSLAGLRQLEFVSPEKGWALLAAGTGTRVLRTGDGGMTWTPIEWELER
ncbi:MAG: hypothetical protein D9V47_01860 [Clostridia bacterium]|nr:MAG: hypothetical protein D9V47_01860 [Clostridia bacterium]